MSTTQRTTQFSQPLSVTPTPIPGLLVVDVPVHGDNRGWFKENWQREKMVALGVPDFGPVQNNVSFNDEVGTTRGIHAEPWDKWVSVASGSIFGAWVDLREGPTFGATFTIQVDPSRAVFVPRGVGNAYQTLEPNTAYTYLVNAHWSSDVEYTFLNLADSDAAIDWPIALKDGHLSAKDSAHPFLVEVKPIPPRKVLVLGAGGQLGRALADVFGATGEVELASRADLDINSLALDDARNWRDYQAIINAAAYTKVDDAETDAGRQVAWSTNVDAVSRLARIAGENSIPLVHISSDYVFDGTLGREYRETDLVCPIGVYGQTKAAGDAIVASLSRHYVVRTSWVIGEGRNFVRTMVSLAQRGVDPSVVNDQVGRLTFATELALGIHHLLLSAAPYGTYNLTGEGSPTSWADIAARVFELTGHDPSRVTGVSTDQYASSAGESYRAPRPRNSVLDLSKLIGVGFRPQSADESLQKYVKDALTQ